MKPYGVLGQQMTVDHRFVSRGTDPKMLSSTCITDPAGLHFIQSSPRGAGGASGAIYVWLGINTDDSFPTDVSEAIKTAGDAKYHCYPSKSGSNSSGHLHVIHTVGPDFRQGNRRSREEAVQELSISYLNIFREFITIDCGQEAVPPLQLRLLPVSGGIFSGPWGSSIAALTFESINAAYLQLTHEQQELLDARVVELCVFAENELEDFARAGFVS